MKKRVLVCTGVFICIAALAAAGFGIFAALDCIKGYIKESFDYRKNLTVRRDNAGNTYGQKAIEDEVGKHDSTSRNKSDGQGIPAAINGYDTGVGTSNLINILALGIDRTEERDKTLGIYRTDSISIIRINLDTKEIKVLCIPRDTYAFVPVENKNDKINHAYAFGSIKKKGIESSIEAINKFVKYSTIDYYFAIDMEPIPAIVDSLGGVELDVELDMKTHGANLSKGFQLLDGKKAFDYIRWRYSGNGDVGRIKRQQKFIKAMFKNIKNSGKLVDCVKIVWKYKDNIKTNMTLDQMISLAVLANNISEENIKYDIIPGQNRYKNKISYWIPDEEKTDKLLKEFFGRLSTFPS